MRTLYFCPVVFSLWPPYGIRQAIIFLPCGFFVFYLSIFLLFFLAYSQPSQIGCLPHFHTWCGLSANSWCRSETCCTRLAENTGRKKIVKNSLSAHHRTNLSGYIFATKALIDSGKNMLSSIISPTILHNMVKISPLAAEIDAVVWSTPANFNWFRVLPALRHGILIVGVSQSFATLNRGRHLYSSGRPSHWPLAHILVLSIFFFSSPNLNRRRLDVCHTSTHGVALLRI